ncbi:MAG: T9SS type A sorting domain-containing protein [Bacteroidetes bacterium]|nr:T9SS type A sorting domain-containing protein [Bacteroidota bacterium]
MRNPQIIFGIFLLSLTIESYSQISGCTDPNANNYNPAANINDGSCIYNLTIYNPPLRFLLPPEIQESSGLAYFNEKLWTINDSGGLPVIYAFDTIVGQIVQRIIVDNAINIDWESLATDDDYIYIGDFGNNLGNRDDLAIYIVSKSDIPLEGDGTAGSTKITFIYSDYKGNTEKKKEHNFDCEAFIATNDSLYLFSKNRGDQKTKLYRLPKMPGDYIAELISTFNVAGLITGADINISSDEITLIGYVDQSWIPFTWLLFDYEGTNFFGGNKRRIDLLNIAATQTEAISYTISKHEVITSEGNFLFSQTAYNFNSALWTDSSPSMILDVASNKFDFSLSPNPVSKSKLTIHINKLPKGEYQIEIFDTFGRLIRIKKYNVSNMDGANKIKIKVGDYTQGTYFVRMRSGNQVVEKKFIKK